jgi:hypothetical protein
MTGASPTPEPIATIKVAGKSMTLDKATEAARNQANWFWWVAGLSLVNSVATMLDAQYAMLLGLGVTQIFDALLVNVLKEATGAGQTVAKLVHLLVVVSAAGFFYFIGVKARQLRLWAFVLGMTMYSLDALIFLVFQDWIGLGFHAFVLFMLWGGYGIAKAISAQSVSRPWLAA